MENFKIFAGSSHTNFATALAEKLEMKLGAVTLKAFSCGEMYVKFEETFRGKDAFLVQTGRTGLMHNDLIELLLMIDAARRSFAEKVHVVMPYFPYSRQDKIHAPREGISAKLFANLLARAGADHLITMHLHSDQIQGFFDFPVDNLNPQRLFLKYFESKKLKDPVIVSPDAGGVKEAKHFADKLGFPLVLLHKNRPGHNKAEVSHVIGDIEGKTPIIIDDMVDTAGSVCGAKETLVERGARDEVYLACTHPIFSGPAVERLDKAGFAEILATDTLPVEQKPKNFHVLSVAPLFANVIQNVAARESVSKLYI
ncbi:MAG: ribose-phosphate pyrophosphokinase [Candidatus Gracilibacteria bacterium]|nr:ribose-phosphate pyrophosphokinase [Candidatus Gracilibacteria bacterium]